MYSFQSQCASSSKARSSENSKKCIDGNGVGKRKVFVIVTGEKEPTQTKLLLSRPL
jgi:hypothetical protein